MSDIPKEHQLVCGGCGKVLDMRDPSCLSHGWIEDGKIVCYDEPEIPYTYSMKVGDNVAYTKDKNPLNLN